MMIDNRSGAPPVISVVTVVYNGSHFIESTLLSVVNQTATNFEFVVIDGGSTDGTLEILSKYQAQISWLRSEPDRGIYDAMNKGVKAAQGEWICFMNCGDHFADNDVLGKITSYFAPQADIVYGDALVHYNTFTKHTQALPLASFWKRMPFSHQASFVRRQLLIENPFNTKYRLSADYDFLYSAYRRGKKFQHAPLLVCRVDYTTGASVSNATRSIAERKQIVLSHGFNLKAWIYYTMFVWYVVASGKIKKVLGTRFTEWIIRLLK